jgi:cell division protein FtsL
MVSGLSVVYMSYENRFLFNELQQLKSQANNLDVQWGQLLIEQSTFGLEGRIEQKATEELHLHVPELERIVMVTHD